MNFFIFKFFKKFVLGGPFADFTAGLTKVTLARALFGVFCVFLFTFFSIALISFSPFDSDLFYDDSNFLPISNFLGKFGAYWSGLLFYFFGDSAFLLLIIPVFCFLVNLRLISFKKNIGRLFGVFVFLVGSCIYFSSVNFSFFSPIIPGGFLGFYLHDYFLNGRYFIYEDLFVFLGLWIGLVTFFQFRWARPIRFFLEAFFSFLLNCFFIQYPKRKFISFAEKISESFKAFISKLTFSEREPEEEELERTVREILEVKEFFGSSSKDRSLTNKTYCESICTKESSGSVSSEPGVNNPEVNKSEINKSSFEKSFNLQGPVSRGAKKAYILPKTDLLDFSKEKDLSEPVLKEPDKRALLLESKLEHFGISGKVTSIKVGPVVTLFEYAPKIDVKISSITAREEDLALALGSLSLRIIAPIPGRSVVGFEVANEKKKTVYFADCLKSSEYLNFRGSLPVILGKNPEGIVRVVDLPVLPHLLLAGSTGSGKSIALHTLITSLLYFACPEHLKLILIDPKRVEFSEFADLPHLLFPIQFELKEVVSILKWATGKMEERYSTMASSGVRDIFEYHKRFGEDSMPFIAIIIDELADLMMMGGKEVEFLIVRIAQKARAAGIHLILATQRPSVDVLTGLIKVNFPVRVAFRVASKVDSRVIIDSMGAEKLLGKGDMLFLNRRGILERVHGSFILPQEIRKTADFVRQQKAPDYVKLSDVTEQVGLDSDGQANDVDLICRVRAFLNEVDEVSISLLQRKFRIGFNRSARIIEQLSNEGVLCPQKKGKNKVVRKSNKDESEYAGQVTKN